MRKVTKVVYFFTDGTEETHDNESDAWDAAWNVDFVNVGNKRKIPQDVIDRLNNIDPAVFPPNLFEEE